MYLFSMTFIHCTSLVLKKILPLMYMYEINDIIFFIKSYKEPTQRISISIIIYSSTPQTLDLVLCQS